MVGLKPTYGGSIPSFLVNKRAVGLERKLALRRCGMGEGNHEVTPH